MKIVSAFLVLFALAGCQTVEQSADAKAEQTGQSTRAYFRCGFAYAGKTQGSREDPYYIAIAAKTSCARERQAVIDVIEDTYNP